MSTARARARRGNAPLRTATQLGEVLTEPLYLLLVGKVIPFFPQTSRAAPSSFVRLMDRSADSKDYAAVKMDIHWEQWKKVGVVVLSDDRVKSWLGGFTTTNTVMNGFLTSGAPVTLPNTVYGPDGTVPSVSFTVNGTTTEKSLTKGTVVGTSLIPTEHLNPLYGNDHEGFKVFLKALIVQTAVAAGYGS